jgi:uncharacterized protein YjiS (DUF1127 family)
MMRVELVSTPNRGMSSLVARGGRIIAGAWQAYWVGRAERATIDMLNSLGDNTLRDIGVARGEIASLVYGRVGDRMR